MVIGRHSHLAVAFVLACFRREEAFFWFWARGSGAAEDFGRPVRLIWVSTSQASAVSGEQKVATFPLQPAAALFSGKCAPVCRVCVFDLRLLIVSFAFASVCEGFKRCGSFV